MKNVLADDNYSIENDKDYYIDEAIFLRDKVYSIKKKDGQ